MNSQLKDEQPLALVTKLQLYSSNLGKYLDWFSRLMMQGVESSGALYAEIFPPASADSTEWILMQRFSSLDQIAMWQKSEGHRKLMDELAPALDLKQVAIVESIDSAYAPKDGIAVAVATHVKEGQERAYFAFEKKYQAAQARRPGYRGAYVQPPLSGSTGTWITIIRFDSSKAMNQWIASDERQKLVAESNQIVKSTDFQNVTTSFPGWFPTEANAGKGPPNWKAALLILLGLYPSVMFVIKFLMPLVHDYPPALTNFVGNILTVAFTTFITMPLLIKVYNPWLFPTESTPKWVSPFSIFTLLLFFAIEIAFIWRFF